MALNLADAERMIEAAEKNGVSLCAGTRKASRLSYYGSNVCGGG